MEGLGSWTPSRPILPFLFVCLGGVFFVAFGSEKKKVIFLQSWVFCSFSAKIIILLLLLLILLLLPLLLILPLQTSILLFPLIHQSVLKQFQFFPFSIIHYYFAVVFLALLLSLQKPS